MSDEEYKIICLARYLLRKTLHGRREMLAAMEKRHGAHAIDRIRVVITCELNRMKEDRARSVSEMRECLK